MLNIIRHGQPTDRPALLIAHGLFGSARNWGVIARRLSDDREVLAVDMRNHGHSPRAHRQGYDDMAADLTEVIAAQGGPLHVLGHSMGGKAAMVLALTRPQGIKTLIVADIAPVAYGHSQSHLIAAMRRVPLKPGLRRAEAQSVLEEAGVEESTRAFLLQSLELKTDPPHWRLNLDVLDSHMADVVGFPQISGKAELPALFLSGAESDYVQPGYREEIRRLFPAARFAAIPRAGHWLHADRPRAFEAAVRVWMEQAETTRR